jgi:hypothetical protein
MAYRLSFISYYLLAQADLVIPVNTYKQVRSTGFSKYLLAPAATTAYDFNFNDIFIILIIINLSNMNGCPSCQALGALCSRCADRIMLSDDQMGGWSETYHGMYMNYTGGV